MVAVVVRRPAEELPALLREELGFISTFCRVEDKPFVPEPFQVAFLRNRHHQRWVLKSRQVGMSLVSSLEALARTHLRNGHCTVFVSYSQREAQERISVARAAYESLPLELQKRLVSDSKHELVFESRGPGQRPSRILSVPAKPPRGLRGDIYLDEFAHCPNDRDIFRGATALILRGHGQMTGISTPLGQRGMFYEAFTERFRRFPNCSRMRIGWWLSRAMCKDPAAAVALASKVSTEELVARFGLPNVLEQLESLGPKDFAQEFCLEFVDERNSYFDYETILRATRDDVEMNDDATEIPVPTGRLVAGFDVCRARDFSVLAVFEQVEGRFVCRLVRQYDRVPFAEQEGELRRVLNTLPVARLSIDASGIGMNLAENLARDFPQVVGETFSNEAKERWATDFKILLQRGDVALPRDRGLVSEIHSIKRNVLPSGKVSFDAERTAHGGHADRFWAIALACQKERGVGPTRGVEIGVRILG